MLGNVNSLLALASDPNYEAKVTGPLQLLQELGWRSSQGVLKANILFLFDDAKDRKAASPFLVLIIEDCFVQLGDDNSLGKEYTYEIKFKTTGKNYVFAAENFKALEKWVTVLTITPMDYIRITKQSFLEQIDDLEEESRKKSGANSRDE
ncbi:hypothetical protein PFISCL1PPCAC_11543 [Pristionchus fissidentatus]|uniref:PH domain-containing protein n=1 Tax=Pristionchus fissidentatus TaxID=1538716 RepID=A0AAV5VLF1_9BILA|nr:hypothetical protein PFISCL1PPCAC_11543 [Pristionchus fissidentatus]